MSTMTTTETSRLVLIASAVAAMALGGAIALTEASPAAAADGCDDGVETDYNGDGYPDLAVGDPSATVDGKANAGTLTISYGSSSSNVGGGTQETLTEDDLGTFSGSDAGDRFAFALASADLDCDGYTDLLASAPYENVGGMADAGMVNVLWGNPFGLFSAGTEYTTASFGMAVAAGDHFGWSIDALEDVGQGGTPAPDAFALAIGVPGRDVGGAGDAGVVAAQVPLDGGTSYEWFTANSPGVPGAAESGDKLGTSVALGYLSGSADLVDLAIGAPYENIGSAADAGDVTVLEDVYDGIAGGFRIDQDGAGVPGIVEAGDLFGFSLDAALVGSRWRLAVGVPKEDVGADTDAGTVQLFASAAGSLDPGSSLGQDTIGVEGAAEPGDVFGRSVAWVPPTDADERSRIAVSVPGEDASHSNTGQVQVIPIFEPASDVVYSQSSTGVIGSPQQDDRFGMAISVISAPGEQALVVGTPADVGYPDGVVAVIPLDGGSPRSLLPGAAGASAFGSAIATDGL